MFGTVPISVVFASEIEAVVTASGVTLSTRTAASSTPCFS